VFAGIGGDVAYSRIDLGQGDAHGGIVGMWNVGRRDGDCGMGKTFKSYPCSALFEKKRGPRVRPKSLTHATCGLLVAGVLAVGSSSEGADFGGSSGFFAGSCGNVALMDPGEVGVVSAVGQAQVPAGQVHEVDGEADGGEAD